MDVKGFYTELAEWVLTINENSRTMSTEAYWQYIITSSGELSKKYNDGPLVKKVILAHIDYLEEMWKKQTVT